jgi:hypothetical protein
MDYQVRLVLSHARSWDIVKSRRDGVFPTNTSDSCASFLLDERFLHVWMWSASIVDFFPAHIMSFRCVRDGTVNLRNSGFIFSLY